MKLCEPEISAQGRSDRVFSNLWAFSSEKSYKAIITQSYQVTYLTNHLSEKNRNLRNEGWPTKSRTCHCTLELSKCVLVCRTSDSVQFTAWLEGNLPCDAPAHSFSALHISFLPVLSLGEGEMVFSGFRLMWVKFSTAPSVSSLLPSQKSLATPHV